MKYALIGCGRIATNHVKAVLNNHLEFAAVCDVIPSRWKTCLQSMSCRTTARSTATPTIRK